MACTLDPKEADTLQRVVQDNIRLTVEGDALMRREHELLNEMVFFTEAGIHHDVPTVARYDSTTITVANMDSGAATRMALQVGCNPVALNFANAHHPGGAYLQHSRAQEEEWCRICPWLYDRLQELRQHYPLADDGSQAAYTQTPICRESSVGYPIIDMRVVAIITAALPNMAHAESRIAFNTKKKLRDRIHCGVRTVLRLAYDKGHDVVILGAWGCGAFKHNPRLVADAFRQLLMSEFAGSFKLAVFAIVDPRGDGNLAAFEDVLMRECELSTRSLKEDWQTAVDQWRRDIADDALK